MLNLVDLFCHVDDFCKHFIPQWRLHLFLWLNKSNVHSADYFKLPYHQVVELGRQIDL